MKTFKEMLEEQKEPLLLDLSPKHGPTKEMVWQYYNKKGKAVIWMRPYMGQEWMILDSPYTKDKKDKFGYIVSEYDPIAIVKGEGPASKKAQEMANKR